MKPDSATSDSVFCIGGCCGEDEQCTYCPLLACYTCGAPEELHAQGYPSCGNVCPAVISWWKFVSERHGR